METPETQQIEEPAKPVLHLNSYQLMILRALQSKPMYYGTVSYAEKLKRRAKGRRAKQARKRNRGR